MTSLRFALALALALWAAPTLPAQRTKPPVPDLTADGQPDDKHDWNLGPTGARGWIWGWKLETSDARQVWVTSVAPGSPAAGLLAPGDVLLGVDGRPFEEDPRRALGHAIGAAEASDGALRLLRWREGESAPITLKLPVLGGYGDAAPWDCARSSAVLARAVDHIAGHMKGDIDGMVNALALLATGDRRHDEAVRKLALQVARDTRDVTLAGRTSGLFAWKWGYRLLFLCEYFLATGDREVLSAIALYALTIAEGQSGVGTWGHGMAWPDLNGGALHGRLGGYGAVNQAGLVCHLALVLAQKCGVRGEELQSAIERANRFAAFYMGKGAIPYGDHRPGWDVHDDNGKNSLAAVLFDLQGMKDEARFFAKMTAASYGERERGHTGNYFSYLWGPLGAARGGPAAAAAFLAEQRWYYDLARRHDGSFGYQGGAGMDGGEHQYADWDCTGAFVLANALPLRRLYITGRGADPGDPGELGDPGDPGDPGELGELGDPVVGRELGDTIAAGRGFNSWDLGAAHYAAKPVDELLALTHSWSPAVRSRAAEALAKSSDVPDGRPTAQHHPRLVEQLAAQLADGALDARYGACQALGALGAQSAAAVPGLIETLGSDDVWLRIEAAYALASIGEPARAAVPTMLRLAVKDDPADTRQFTQRYLAFCLFYRGGALGMRGLLARSLDGVDRELLYPAVRRMLQNDDGRARATIETVYANLDLEEVMPLLPAIVEAIEVASPSGVMFSSGIRLAGLDLLARHRVAEGLPLCLKVIELDLWGKQDRAARCLKALAQYGGAARPVLPELRALEAALASHKEARSLAAALELCRRTIQDIEAATEAPPLRTIEELTRGVGPAARTVRVFVLAGQSNMVGAGVVDADPSRNGGRGTLEHLVRDPATAARYAHLVDDDGHWRARDDVWISYFERRGPLNVGYGASPDRVGPELEFGHVVGARYEEPVLLIKVAWGGKSLAEDFRPPSSGGEVGPYYRALFQEIRETLAQLDERFPELAGCAPRIAGIGWHQGWNDRVNQAFNDAYEENLVHFIRDARRELGIPDLPFVIAETGMTGPSEVHPRALSLMRAQAAVAQREELRGTVAFVPTRDFYRAPEDSPSAQGYHWNSNAETYCLIGEAMGQAMGELCDRDR